MGDDIGEYNRGIIKGETRILDHGSCAANISHITLNPRFGIFVMGSSSKKQPHASPTQALEACVPRVL